MQSDLGSNPVNANHYHVVPSSFNHTIHAQHDYNTTSGMDPHLRGDDNKGQG